MSYCRSSVLLLRPLALIPETPSRFGLASQAYRHQLLQFGTNDLIWTAVGISRDDAGRFLARHLDAGVFGVDPFASLDVEAVDGLMQVAAARGRMARPDLKLSIRADNWRDPASLTHRRVRGLDCGSYSLYRRPIARLAAARSGRVPYRKPSLHRLIGAVSSGCRYPCSGRTRSEMRRGVTRRSGAPPPGSVLRQVNYGNRIKKLYECLDKDVSASSGFRTPF